MQSSTTTAESNIHFSHSLKLERSGDKRLSNALSANALCAFFFRHSEITKTNNSGSNTAINQRYIFSSICIIISYKRIAIIYAFFAFLKYCAKPTVKLKKSPIYQFTNCFRSFSNSLRLFSRSIWRCRAWYFSYS